MAEVTLNLSGLSEVDVRRAGWATETTLAGLASHAAASEALLRLIAKKDTDKDTVDAIAKGNSQRERIGQQTDRGLGSLGTGVRDLSKNTDAFSKNLSKNMSGIASGLKGMATSSADSPLAVINAVGYKLDTWGYKLAQTNPALAKVATFAGGLAAVFSTLVHNMFALTDNYRELISATGDYGSSVGDLLDVSKNTGLSMQDVTKTMTKFSGVSASLGTKNMGNLMKSFDKLSNSGSNLMMTQRDSQESFVEALEQMRLSGQIVGLTQDQIATRGFELVESYNQLSEATGRNRSEIMKGTTAIMAQNKMYVASRGNNVFGQQMQKTVSSLVAQFGQEGATPVANMIQALKLGGPALMDPETRKAFAQMPGDIQRTFDAISSGAINEEDAGKALGDALQGVDLTEYLKMGAVGEKVVAMLGPLQQQSDIIRKRNELEIRDPSIKAARLANEAAAKGLQKAQNDSKAAINQFQIAMLEITNQLTPVLIPALNALSETIVFLVEKFNSFKDTLTGMFSSMGMSNGSAQSAGAIAAVVTTIVGGGLLLSILKTSILKMSGALLSPFKVLAGKALPDLGKTPGLPKLGPGKMLGELGEGLGKFGPAISSLGKGVGGIIEGVLTGIANGISAFKPQVLIGAAVLAGSIFIIGTGIAGATWIMGKALPSLAEGLKSFEGINGRNLIDVGLGVGALGAGLAIFGVGQAAGGIGGILGNLADSINGFFGGKTPLEKVVEFSKYDIDAEKTKNNATALVAFGTAMAVYGGGALVGLYGTLSQAIGSFFTVKPPMDQLQEFSSKPLGPYAKVNAEAFAAFATGMAAFSGGGIVSSVAEGIAKSIRGFFGVKPPVDQLKDFSNLSLGPNTLQNAQAFTAFATAMSKYEGSSGGFFAALADGISSFFRVTPPMDQMVKFSNLVLGPNTEKNAQAFTAFATAMASYQGSSVGVGAAIGDTIKSWFGSDTIDMLKKFGEIRIDSAQIQQNADAFKAFTGVDVSASALEHLKKAIDGFDISMLERIFRAFKLLPAAALPNLGTIIALPATIPTIQIPAVAATSSGTVGTTIPVISTAELNMKTIKYYEKTVQQFDNMIDLLNKTYDRLDDQKTSNERALAGVTDAVQRIGRI